MRLILLCATLAFNWVNNAYCHELKQVSDHHVMLQGGDDISSAFSINEIPFSDSGTTAGYTHDYTLSCGNSYSPDVIYSYTPSVDGAIDVSLCGSDFDTILGILDEGGTPLRCNDEFCGSQSQIRNLVVVAGTTYYIDITGYHSASGNYVLNVSEYMPYIVICPPNGTPEGEPLCGDEYVDNYNSGCGGVPEILFQDINMGDIICGQSGTFLITGLQARDTDWFRVTLDQQNTLHWKAVADFPPLLIILSVDCNEDTFYAFGMADAGDTVDISANLPAGQYACWIGPSVFEGYPCPSNYVATTFIEFAPCIYLPGDINDNGSVNGVDIVYAVNYLKGTGPHPPTDCFPSCPLVSNPFYAAGDVNGNCATNGIDITFFVRYLKGQVPSLLYCTDCPPASMAPPAPEVQPISPPVIKSPIKSKPTGSE